MKQEPGVTLYKCRRCGKVKNGVHTPDAFKTMIHLLHGKPLPREWGGVPISKQVICSCDDGSYGVSDCIGFAVD